MTKVSAVPFDRWLEENALSDPLIPEDDRLPIKDDDDEHVRPSRKRPKSKPVTITARDLCALEFEPIKYVVPGYIAEGLTLFAGKPKLGKSWFCMEIGIAVSEAGICLGGVKCEAGDVLYLALEDNTRRLQSRINKLWQMEAMVRAPVPERLHLATEWPRANEGGIDAIRDWIKVHPEARLVIVDVLAMFKATAKGKDQTLYEADYMAIKELQSLAMETGVAIVVVHHTRKSGAEADPFEKVSGTLGLSGAADTTLILDRDQEGCTLYGRGRDIEEIETAVQFDKLTCRWRALGNAAEVRRTDERSEILSVLIDATEPMNPRDISIACGMPRNNADQLLFKMAKAGEVLKSGRGLYVHPDRSDLIAASPSTPDKNDKKIRNYVDGGDEQHGDADPESYHLIALTGGASGEPDKRWDE
ncbi:AAA family ATPase [Mesorhizobium yinganensis]|uniref:AAA family ATPase n=1 Tax=Mesorhizobium yinganensis TaxID=3157707 RepID=UPI0032B74936